MYMCKVCSHDADEYPSLSCDHCLPWFQACWTRKNGSKDIGFVGTVVLLQCVSSYMCNSVAVLQYI